MLSTRDLSGLPDVNALRRLMRSMAMLDAILSPDWDYRYFSFNDRWAPGEQMGSMRNGQGDHYFSLFNAAGCWLKGFDHEAPMSPFAADPPVVAPGMLDSVPNDFAACLREPAFVLDETTFCVWRRYANVQWERGPVAFPDGKDDPDGSERLLRWLDGRPQTYRSWAEGYYELPVQSSAVEAIYAHQPLTAELLSHLNANVTLDTMAADAAEIGYPER